jgi:hypothetical protein
METYGAKQVATRIGTDPKTLRKFLRSAASPYESVGQGGRYDFPVEDLPEIDKAFHKWHNRGAKKSSTPTKRTVKRVTKAAPIEDEDDDFREPTEEELAELDELEFDDPLDDYTDSEE